MPNIFNALFLFKKGNYILLDPIVFIIKNLRIRELFLCK